MLNFQLGSKIDGEINTLNNEQYYSVTLVEGEYYRFNLNGVSLKDPVLSLMDSNNTVLQYSDDSNGTKNSEIYFRATYSGVYYLLVQGHGQNIGTYTIDSKIADDFKSNFSYQIADYELLNVTNNANFDVAKKGNIEISGDKDIFVINLTAGATYVFDVVGDNNFDTTLSLHDINGKQIAFNDDVNGATFNSRIVYTASENGSYYLNAGGFGSKKGTYLISARYFDDMSSNINTQGKLAPTNSLISGVIETTDDHDWFKVQLVAGNTYKFNMTSDKLDVVLSLRDSKAEQVTFFVQESQSNSVDTYDLKTKSVTIIYTPSVTGAYYLDASSSSNIGEFSLKDRTYKVSLGFYDDYLGSINTTTMLTESLTGSVEIAKDRDWFKTTLVAGENYIFSLRETNNSKLDTTLYLRDENGNVLGFNDDSNGTLNSQIIYTATQSGTYYLDAGGFGSKTGKYEILKITDDHIGGVNTKTVISADNISVNGQIDIAKDRDWFEVQLTKGTEYQFNVSGVVNPDSTYKFDANLYLRDTNGNRIAFNDDFGGTLNSQITYLANSTGKYFLDVGAYASGYGKYNIVAKVSDDYLGSVNTEANLAGGTLVGSNIKYAELKGNIEKTGDRDWFKVELIEGTNNQFNLIGDSGFDGNLYLRDDKGNMISFNDNYSPENSKDSQISYIATKSGVYFLDVGSSDSKVGSYTILSTTNLDDYTESIYTTAHLPIGATIEGGIGASDDRDWFKVTLAKNAQYEFFLNGKNGFDGVMYIRDSNGVILDSNDNSNGGKDSYWLYTAKENGVYFLDIGSSDLKTGAYSVQLKHKDDYLDSSSTQKVVSTNNVSVDGSLETTTDRDWFKVELIAGKKYIFNVDGDNEADIDLYLRDLDGSKIDYNNDSGGTKNSQIAYTATRTGTYYLDVGCIDLRNGSYKLTARALEIDAITDAKVWRDFGDQTILEVQDNIKTLWEEGINGQNVDVAVYDTKIASESLAEVGVVSTTYDNSILSWDEGTNHGAYVASIIASRADNFGVVGIAYGSNIHALTMGSYYSGEKNGDGGLDNTDILYDKIDDVDIVNLSISAGPSSDLGKKIGEINEKSFSGRDNLGTIICKAAGNGGISYSANLTISGESNVITVGNIQVINYSNYYDKLYEARLVNSSIGGEANLICAPGNGVLATIGNDPTQLEIFNGTSSATPYVSGVCALILDMNSNLGSRDVQEILAYSAYILDTSRIESLSIRDVLTYSNDTLLVQNGANNYNGGGLMFNQYLGFGMVNPLAAVHLSKYWLVGQEAQSGLNRKLSKYEFTDISESINLQHFTYKFNIEEHLNIEHLKLYLKSDSSAVIDGNLCVNLISPNGTKSEIYYNYKLSNNEYASLYAIDYKELMGAGIRRFMGEDINGEWTIEIWKPNLTSGQAFNLNGIELEFSGGDVSVNDRYVFSDDFASLLSQDSSRGAINDTNGGSDDTINFAAVISNKIVVDGIKNEFKIGSSKGTFSDIENIVGGELNDTIIANSLMKEIYGGYGDDIIDLRQASADCQAFGGAGADCYIVNNKYNNISEYTQIASNNIDYRDLFDKVAVLDTSNNGYVSKEIVKSSGEIIWEQVSNYVIYA